VPPPRYGMDPQTPRREVAPLAGPETPAGQEWGAGAPPASPGQWISPRVGYSNPSSSPMVPARASIEALASASSHMRDFMSAERAVVTRLGLEATLKSGTPYAKTAASLLESTGHSRSPYGAMSPTRSFSSSLRSAPLRTTSIGHMTTPTRGARMTSGVLARSYDSSTRMAEPNTYVHLNKVIQAYSPSQTSALVGTYKSPIRRSISKNTAPLLADVSSARPCSC
jgi:hypothetical protein